MPCIILLHPVGIADYLCVMPRPRIVMEYGGCYHCISRVVDRQFIFGDAEKEFFVTTMRKLEAFLGVNVLTYCVMSNHFHLLVEVPDPEELPELTVGLLRRRLPLLYHGKALAAAREEIDRAVTAARTACKDGNGNGNGESFTDDRLTSPWIEAILERYRTRMGDLSVFLKELKWRFSRWHNQRADRVGTLWEDRFRSVVVEGDEHALMTIAAYIDLNPIRAGLVDDPAGYRWCGYAEAVAGKKTARRNLAKMHARMRAWQGDGTISISWREVGPTYRIHLFGTGERRLGNPETGRGARLGIDPEKVARVVDERGENGELTFPEKLLHRVRHFCDGVAIGSEGFVERVFESHRDHFGPRRKTGARRLRGKAWGSLRALRDLRDQLTPD